jgi:stalled ribosome rescue protein Dom34
MPSHAAIWIDHKEARTFHLHPESTDETTVLAPQHHIHRHPKGRGEPREHPDDAQRFFAAVSATLEGADAILILGPSTAKTEFSRYLRENLPKLAAGVVGVERADHLTDGQIVARARKHFLASDRMG